MGNGSRAAAAQTLWIPPHIFKDPLGLASGPSGCPCSTFLPGSSSCRGAASTPRAQPQPPPCGRLELQPRCTTAPPRGRPGCVSFAPPASSPTESNPHPFSGASVPLHRLPPIQSLLQVSARDHLFCDTFAHWLQQMFEPAGLSCLIHTPPLSPEASNSHPPELQQVGPRGAG